MAITLPTHRICWGCCHRITPEETERNMYDAIEMHVQGLKEDKQSIPESSSYAEYVLVRSPK